MKAQTALVRPDGTVHLNSEAAVYMYLPLIILPRYPK